MAVQIPVVVDIEGAFQDAARRAKSAMQPFINQLSKQSLGLRFHIDKKSTKSVQDLLNDPTIKANQLKTALKQVEEQIRKMQAAGGLSGSSPLTQKERELLTIYAALQQRIRGTTDVLRQFGATVSAQVPGVGRLSNALSAQTGILSRLTAMFSSYVSIYSLFRFAKQIRDVTGELEYQRVALGYLLRDEEYGNTLFEKIKAAAIESPFRIKELVTYTKQLAAFRIEQEELFDTMHRLADVSAGLGVDMNRLILAYGQVRAASVLRGQELRQFTEAGIPLVDMLAEKFSELNGKAVKTADVFDLISKRAVPFSMIAEIFEDLTDKGGMFYEMQKRQAETLKGRWEKLKDAFDIGLQTVGETETFQKANDKILSTLTALANNLVIVPKAINGATAAMLSFVAASKALTIWTNRAVILQKAQAAGAMAWSIITGKVNVKLLAQVALAKALTKAQLKLAAATNIASRAFWKMSVAILSNPWTAALAGIVGIATMLFTFRKRTDEVVSSFEDFDSMIEQTSVGLKDVSKVDKLIDRYERLAEKTDRTAKENQRLFQTMSLLQEKFPDVAIGIDGTTKSIEEQVSRLRELNSEAEKETRLRGEEELRSRKIELENAEKEYEKLYKKRLDLRERMNTSGLKENSSAYVEWTKRIEDTNAAIDKQREKIDGLQKRIVALNRILHPDDTANPFNAWQRQIQSMRDITVDGTTSPIFTDEQIEKWETLDAALAAIDKRKKEVAKREDELSKAIKNQTGEIKEQIQSELEWARAERLRLEAMQDFFKTPTVFAKDIMDNFSNLLLKTYDEGNLKKFGEGLLGLLSMQTNIAFNKDLLSRPLVDAADLVKKGWENAGEGIATVFSSVYDWTDEYGNKHNILVTPILPDGSVLSPEELDDYVKNVLLASGLKNDEKKLLLGVDVSEDASEKLHEMQEEYYRLVKLSEHLPEQFLITDDELLKLKTATDVLNLLNEKISSVEKELDKVEQVKLAPNISEEAIQAAERYSENLQEVYNWLLALRGRYTDPLSDIAKDVQSGYEDIIEATYKGKDKESYAKTGLFSNEDLEKIKNVIDLYSVWSQKLNAVNSEISHYNKQLSASLSDDQRQKILDTIATLDVEKKALERLGGDYGFVLNTKDTGGGGYQQDPWILLYKNRMKFMQDFRKGVEDLNKYMANSDALIAERSAMEGRGASLGFDVQKLNGSRRELLDWYDSVIADITKKIGELGGRTWENLGVQAILAKDTKSRTLKAYQDLLADVFKERTDFDLSQQKKDLEAAIKKLSDEIKRSETAKNFYDNILDLTGDKDLAATMSANLYGDTGNDLQKKIKESLNKSFVLDDLKLSTDNIDVSSAKAEVAKALSAWDLKTLVKYLPYVVDQYQASAKEILDSQNKTEADYLAGLYKTYQKTKTYEERITDIRKKEAEARAKIEADTNLPNEQKQILTNASRTAEAQAVASVLVEQIKDTYEWGKAFEDLDRVGNITLNNLREKIEALIAAQKKNLTPEQLKALTDALEKVKETQATRDPIGTIVQSWRDVKTLSKQFEAAKKEGSDMTGVIEDGLRDANKQMELGIQGVADYMTQWQSVVDTLSDAFDLEEVPILGETLQGISDSLGFVAKILPVIITLNAILNKTLMVNPILAAGAAVVATVGAIAGLIKGIVNAKIEKLNKEFKEQERILDRLEESYEIIGDIIEDSFGNDYVYNYNEQLKNLQAQQEAYIKQAENREKAASTAKKKDDVQQFQEEAEEARRSAAEVGRAISDLAKDAQSAWAGTSLADAAKSFAESWLDAYKEFGSTSDAIEERMQEMVENIITKAALAGVAQAVLQPWFDELDNITDWDPSKVAEMVNKAYAMVPVLNEGLSIAASRVADAGVNIRKQVGSFSGISRNIATASEESILGLAAGINTQNYYISHVPTISENVAKILSALTGTENVAGLGEANAATIPYVESEIFMGQMNNIDQNLASLLSALNSVITAKNQNTNTHYIAVK